MKSPFLRGLILFGSLPFLVAAGCASSKAPPLKGDTGPAEDVLDQQIGGDLDAEAGGADLFDFGADLDQSGDLDLAADLSLDIAQDGADASDSAPADSRTDLKPDTVDLALDSGPDLMDLNPCLGKTCSDGLACTSDICKAGVCSNPLKSGYCKIGGKCYLSSKTNPANSCQICNSSKSKTKWSAGLNGVSCTDDGLSCTSDVCSAGACKHTLSAGFCKISGKCYAQNSGHPTSDCLQCLPGKTNSAWSKSKDGTTCSADTLSCTSDVCKAGKCSHLLKTKFCKISGSCYAAGAAHPSIQCNACNPALSTSAWTAAANGAACASDGISCTNDICSGGSCTHPYKNNFCHIGGTCYSAGSTQPGNLCQRCDPTKSKKFWSAAANGATCASDGISCTKDICAGGSCTHPYDSNSCYIGGVCYSSGATQPGNSCQRCEPAKSKNFWSAAGNGIPCTPDSLSCTSDTCQGGNCTHPLMGAFCLIGSQCYAHAAANPTGGCSFCNANKDQNGWTAITYNGCCASQQLYYCNSGSLAHLDCSVNPACGWSSLYGYYDCGTAGGTGPTPKSCF